MTNQTQEQKPARSRTLFERIARWYQDDRAHYYRYVSSEADLESYNPYMSQKRKTELQRESIEAAKKAKYHWNLARKYEGRIR